MAVVPVRKRPGLYYNTDTKAFFNLVEYRDEDRYDTVSLASGSLTGLPRLDLFKDLGSKNKIDSNLDTARRLSQGEEMIIRRVGVDIPQAYGNIIKTGADVKKVAYNGYLEIKVNKFIIASGPLYAFPCGYGVTGSTVENNTSALTIGVASTAAVRNLEKSHEITSDHDLEGEIRFEDRTWDASNVASTSTRTFIRVFLGGLVRRAATK